MSERAARGPVERRRIGPKLGSRARSSSGARLTRRHTNAISLHRISLRLDSSPVLLLDLIYMCARQCKIHARWLLVNERNSNWDSDNKRDAPLVCRPSSHSRTINNGPMSLFSLCNRSSHSRASQLSGRPARINKRHEARLPLRPLAR